MEYIKEFFDIHDTEKRKEISDKIRTRFPDRIPVIVDRRSEKDPKCTKNKFIVPEDITMGKFISEFRNNVRVGSIEALFFFCGSHLLASGKTMRQIDA